MKFFQKIKTENIGMKFTYFPFRLSESYKTVFSIVRIMLSYPFKCTVIMLLYICLLASSCGKKHVPADISEEEVFKVFITSNVLSI